MKKFIQNYINLMNKYILVKLGTILLILMLVTQILTLINKNVNKQNPISKYNTYSTETLTVKDIAERYFNEYKLLLLYDIDLAYETLSENFKNEFEDIDEFKEYIKKIDLENAELKDYSVTEEDGYKTYIISDNMDNSYSFLVKAANEYNVILNFSDF